MEFWNSSLTEKSWEILQKLKKKYNFILIGGWATYLWVKQQKSKDIDIVIDISELQKFKDEITKNDHLKKYELKEGDIDVDIYVPYYSKLTIPTEDIKNYTLNVEGFNVVCPEALLILKQGAEIERQNSIKGEKDKIDIMSLLFFSNLDFNLYKTILKKYSLEKYIDRLIFILRNFKDYESLNLNPRQFKLNKEKILSKLRKF